jgi:hypothetical protein
VSWIFWQAIVGFEAGGACTVCTFVRDQYLKMQVSSCARIETPPEEDTYSMHGMME